MTTKETVVVTLDLPEGTDLIRYPDLNVIAIASRLDGGDRERVLTEAGVL